MEKYLFRDDKDQEILYVNTVFETNIFRDSKVGLLVAVRGLLVLIMIWLLIEEFQFKGAPHITMYTVWGELSTFLVTILLFICSIEKYKKHQLYEIN